MHQLQSASPSLLDPRFVVSGQVIAGARMGRVIGYPTANIAVAAAPPHRGIYAAYARVNRRRTYLAVAYFGARPTVGGHGDLLEVHLFGFDKDIYGQRLDVELVAHIRDDHHFATVDLMQSQMTIDCLKARQALMSCTPMALTQIETGRPL